MPYPHQCMAYMSHPVGLLHDTDLDLANIHPGGILSTAGHAVWQHQAGIAKVQLSFLLPHSHVGLRDLLNISSGRALLYGDLT